MPKTPPTPTGFTRLHTTDVDVDRVVQDIYDKLAQLQSPVAQVANQISQINAVLAQKPVAPVVTHTGGGTTITTPSGGTGLVNPMSALGDMIDGGPSGVATRLPGNTTTTPMVLSQTGTGTASALPVWVNPSTLVTNGPTVQTNYSTSGRVLGTIYQNTGTTPRYISVSLSMAVGQSSVAATTDSSSTPTTVCAQATVPTSGLAGYVLSMFFIVLPGNYYKVSNVLGTNVIQEWFEWQ